MRNPLSGRFEFRELCRFAWPSVIMLVFMALYTMVDGVFVARLVGTDALSAVNLVFPFIMLYYGIGIMLATGSAAIVARQMGEGQGLTARRNFTGMLLISIGAGIVIGLLGHAYLESLLRFLGATGEMYPRARGYLLPLLFFVPSALLQTMFQSYFVAAGRPGLGLATVASGGVVNIILDYVFIAVMGQGISGAALATGIGYSVPAVAGLAYFSLSRTNVLRLARPAFAARVLIDSVVNGSSEMVTNISAAIVTYLFNIAMLRYIGVDGVAAITIVLYAEFMLNSVYFGFATGVSPLFSYQYGKGGVRELKRLFRNSLIFIAVSSAVSVSAALLLGGRIIGLFAPVGSDVFVHAAHGIRLFSLGFVIIGFNVFFSSLFTALSNGKISALLAFFRFTLIALCIPLLPKVIGVDGIWLAVPVAELATVLVGVLCVRRYRPAYRYF